MNPEDVRKRIEANERAIEEAQRTSEELDRLIRDLRRQIERSRAEAASRWPPMLRRG